MSYIMENTNNLGDWQKRFYDKPMCYATFLDNEILHYYTTEAAAQYEITWATKRRKRQTGMRIVPIYAHDDQLSKERWGDGID